MRKITLLIILLSFPLSTLKAQLTEGFEDGVPPAGWVSFRGANGLGTAQDWKTSTTAHTGSASAFNQYENVSGGLAQDWLVTSSVNLSSSINSELRFFARQQFSNLYSSLYEVRVSTTSQTDRNSFTVVESWDETTLNSPYNVFVEKIVDLSAYDGLSSVYVAFVHTNDNDDSWYIDDVSIANGPSCSQPISSQVSIITNTTANLSWASVASASNGYEWKVMSSGGDPDVDAPIASSTTAAGTTTATATGLAASTTYDFYVRANCDTNGISTWRGPVVFVTKANAPVANDLCINAISLIHQTNTTYALATPTAGSIINAYNSTQPYLFCAYGVSDANEAVKDDIWYSFVATASNVKISYNSNFDAVADLFSGTCGNLTKLACSDIGDPPNGANLEEINYSGLTVGQTYYTRVFYIQTTVPANGNVSVRVWTEDVLSIDEIEDQNGFTYFPNPVKNTLNLKAHNNIQNVSIYNMLGQEVVRTSPNSVNNEVDMSSLQAGAYIVRVTINDNTKTIRIIKQ